MKNLTKFFIFDKLSAAQLGKINSILQEESFDAGEVITREDEVGDALFLLLKGTVEVSKSLTLMVGKGDLDTRDKSLIHLKADDLPRRTLEHVDVVTTGLQRPRDRLSERDCDRQRRRAFTRR